MVLTWYSAYYKTVKENHSMSNYSDTINREDVLLIDNFGKPIDPAIRERYDLMAVGKGIAVFKKKGMEFNQH